MNFRSTCLNTNSLLSGIFRSNFSSQRPHVSLGVKLIVVKYFEIIDLPYYFDVWLENKKTVNLEQNSGNDQYVVPQNTSHTITQIGRFPLTQTPWGVWFGKQVRNPWSGKILLFI